MDQFEELGGRVCSIREESRVKKLVDEITVSRENRPRPAGESVRGPRGIVIVGVRTGPTPWGQDEVEGCRRRRFVSPEALQLEGSSWLGFSDLVSQEGGFGCGGRR